MNPIEIIKSSQLEPQNSDRWDKYVTSHDNHTPYQLAGWLRAVSAAYNHNVIYIFAQHDGNIVGVLPLVNIKLPIKGSNLVSLPFCDIGGCLADNDDVKQQLEQYVEAFSSSLNTAPPEYRERDYQADEQSFDGQKVSMLLDLPETSDELMASFKSKLRSQIRKAEKNGLTVEIGVSDKLISQFYKVFSGNMHRLGSPVHSQKWIESICKEFEGHCVLSIVYLGAVPVGGGLVLFTQDKAVIPWASTVAQYNKLSPNMLLYWSLLKYITDSGCQQFDFGRSTYKEGTFKFKQQWGAKPFLLTWRRGSQVFDKENGDKDHSSLKTLVETVWKKLPLSIVNIVGPKVRRFISL